MTEVRDVSLPDLVAQCKTADFWWRPSDATQVSDIWTIPYEYGAWDGSAWTQSGLASIQTTEDEIAALNAADLQALMSRLCLLDRGHLLFELSGLATAVVSTALSDRAHAQDAAAAAAVPGTRDIPGGRTINSAPLSFGSNGALDPAAWTVTAKRSSDSATVQNGALIITNGTDNQVTAHSVRVTSTSNYGPLDLAYTATTNHSVALYAGTPDEIGFSITADSTGRYFVRLGGNLVIDASSSTDNWPRVAAPWRIRLRVASQGDALNIGLKIWKPGATEPAGDHRLAWQVSPANSAPSGPIAWIVNNRGHDCTISDAVIGTTAPMPAPTVPLHPQEPHSDELGIPNDGSPIALIPAQAVEATAAGAALTMDPHTYGCEQPTNLGAECNGRKLVWANGAKYVRHIGRTGPYVVLDGIDSFEIDGLDLAGVDTATTYVGGEIETESGLRLNGTKNVTISNFRCADVGADAVQANGPFTSVLIRNLTVRNARRQAVSCKNGNKFHVDGFDIVGAGHSLFDVEAYAETDTLAQVLIENGTGTGHHNFAVAAKGSGSVADLTVRQCTFIGGLGLADVEAESILLDAIVYRWSNPALVIAKNLRGLLLNATGTCSMTNCDIEINSEPQTTINGVRVTIPIRGTSGTVDGCRFQNTMGGVVGVSPGITIGTNTGNMQVIHV